MGTGRVIASVAFLASVLVGREWNRLVGLLAVEAVGLVVDVKRDLHRLLGDGLAVFPSRHGLGGDLLAGAETLAREIKILLELRKFVFLDDELAQLLGHALLGFADDKGVLAAGIIGG